MSTPNGSTNGVHHASSTDADLDMLYAWMPGLSPAPAPCPEALFSLTLRGTLDGQEALLTARGMTASEFRANVAALRGLLDPKGPAPAASTHQLSAQQHNAAAMHRPVSDFCPVHNVPMKQTTKDGRSWYSHYDETAGRWCKGK